MASCSPPSTREFLRKSRELMREEQRHGFKESHPITIRVSPKKKKTVARTPQSESVVRLTTSDEYVTLVVQGGEEIILPKEVAFHSGCAHCPRLDRLLHSPSSSLSLSQMSHISSLCSLLLAPNGRSLGATATRPALPIDAF